MTNSSQNIENFGLVTEAGPPNKANDNNERSHKETLLRDSI